MGPMSVEREAGSPRAAPAVAGLVALLFVATGRVAAAVALVLVAVGLAHARALFPAFSRRFDPALARFAHGVAAVVSWVLLSVVFVLVIAPLALLRGVVGRRRRGWSADWLARRTLRARARPGRTFGVDVVHRGPARLPRTVVALAALAAIVIVDLVGGAVLSGTGALPGERGQLARDVRVAMGNTMGAPAIRDEPWAEEFGREMLAFELRGVTYIPYLVRGFREFHGQYLNTTDRERATYQPEVPAGARPLRIGFFGGSAMFGVGQRDDHTIASEFARAAEAAGVPVEVHNSGFPGYVVWQEYQYLERLLADGEQFDLVVFYDGFNEVGVQLTDYSPDPTHYGAPAFRDFALGVHEDQETQPGFGDGLGELADAYERNSALFRIYHHLTGSEPDPFAELSGPPATPEERTDAALDIYGRGLARVDDLVGDGDLPVRFFWQPAQAGWSQDVIDRLPPEVVDLSQVFGDRGDEIFIDEVHTNEEGARLVAQAMWDELGPDLARQAAG
jgi:lysophospholipase L1-like esterase